MSGPVGCIFRPATFFGTQGDTILQESVILQKVIFESVSSNNDTPLIFRNMSGDNSGVPGTEEILGNAEMIQ